MGTTAIVILAGTAAWALVFVLAQIRDELRNIKDVLTERKEKE